MTFESALDQFRQALAKRKDRRGQTLSARTQTERLQIVARLWRELGGALLAPDADLVPRLDRWRDALDNAYQDDRVSESKVRADVYTLQLFYELLKRDPNPAAHLDLGPMPRRKPRPMPKVFVDQIFALVEPDGDPIKLRDRAMFGLLLNGLRRIEVCRTHTRSFRFDPDDETFIFTVHGKGDKYDEIPLGVVPSRFLAEYMLYRFGPASHYGWVEKYRLKLGGHPEAEHVAWMLACDQLLRKMPDSQPAEPLFLHNEKPMTEREFNRIFAHYRTKAELPKYESAAGRWKEYGPHSLRHTFATELLEAGLDSRIVQKLMRHERLSTTEGYMDVRKGPLASAVRKMYAPRKEVAHVGAASG